MRQSPFPRSGLARVDAAACSGARRGNCTHLRPGETRPVPASAGSRGDVGGDSQTTGNGRPEHVRTPGREAALRGRVPRVRFAESRVVSGRPARLGPLQAGNFSLIRDSTARVVQTWAGVRLPPCHRPMTACGPRRRARAPAADEPRHDPADAGLRAPGEMKGGRERSAVWQLSTGPSDGRAELAVRRGPPGRDARASGLGAAAVRRAGRGRDWVVAARCTTGATRVAAQLPVQSGPFSTIVGLEPDSRRDERQRRQRVDRTRLRPVAP